MNQEKLLAKARNNPADVRFSDACALAEAYAFRFIRQTGSHRQFGREGVPTLVNLQPEKNGKAKPYQVRQLVKLIDAYGDSV
ncbi:MAG: type II toxin-antitoxin system HicA family toxin [Chloroflexia bacterium]|nr:type II toxin-antitoxin system HicA family toxin [Chloroflexia bacterium]